MRQNIHSELANTPMKLTAALRRPQLIGTALGR